MATTNDTYDLLSLLPTNSYTLVYALPLFLVSLVLTFAGCFLTLDRTRAFSPVDVQTTTGRAHGSNSWLKLLYLGGGVGGLCAGYSFGVHFSTFLSLLLPNTTSTSPLGHKAFLAIWIISALVCTPLGGKWKYAAMTLIGISGFCTLALAISVIVHPSLLSRVVLVAVFTPLGTILCLLPFPRYARMALAAASSSVGAFGTTLAIALFSRNPSWGNVWERLWLHDGDSWGTSKEKGLSAAFCFLFCAGLLADWFLHNKIGENPDEKWDRYLASYTADLPNDSRRAGTFAPLMSFWDKLLGRHGSFAPVVPDVIFPSDADMKIPLPPNSPVKLAKSRSIYVQGADVPDSKSRLALLRKKDSRRDAKSTRGRRTIKFNPEDVSSSDSEEETSSLPSRRSKTDSSGTLVEPQRIDTNPLLRPPERRWVTQPGEIPDYSDGEEDITAVGRRSPDVHQPTWPPEFIRRHSTRVAPSPLARLPAPVRSVTLPVEPTQPMVDREQTASRTSARSVLPSAGITSIPATPSLIKAVERIQLAHDAVQRAPSIGPATPFPAERKASWDHFWNDVKAKAHY